MLNPACPCGVEKRLELSTSCMYTHHLLFGSYRLCQSHLVAAGPQMRGLNPGYLRNFENRSGFFRVFVVVVVLVFCSFFPPETFQCSLIWKFCSPWQESLKQ